jgi:hypothetical protein
MKRITVLIACSLGLVACNLGKKEDTPQPASTETAQAVQTGAAPAATNEAPAAGDNTKSAPADKGGSDTAGSPAGSPTTVAQKDEKKVQTTPDGKNVQLENEKGKGSVVTSGGKTTVTGKSGRSIEIPIGR